MCIYVPSKGHPHIMSRFVQAKLPTSLPLVIPVSQIHQPPPSILCHKISNPLPHNKDISFIKILIHKGSMAVLLSTHTFSGKKLAEILFFFLMINLGFVFPEILLWMILA